MFEQAVRDTSGDPNFTMPYWDWTDQSSLDVVFDDDFMGPAEGDPKQNYAVVSGPFRRGNFTINLTASAFGHNDFQSRCPFPYLTRGEKDNIRLPTVADVSALLEVDIYDSPPYDATADIHRSFRNYLLGAPDPTASPTSLQGMSRLHRLLHLWVGGQWDATVYSEALKPGPTTFVGTMTAIDCSPNDPVFWLHHCNVDRPLGHLGNNLRQLLRTDLGRQPGLEHRRRALSLRRLPRQPGRNSRGDHEPDQCSTSLGLVTHTRTCPDFTRLGATEFRR